MAAVSIDPISFEVIRNALVAATDEMVLTLKRSAYSTNIKTRSDFSCAFFDAELRSVAQGFAQPVHLGSMVEQVPNAIRTYGAENLEAGDVIVTNDPHPSGVHLNDVSLISPVHHDGRLLGYVANLAHHVDVGGGAPASIGAFREVFQEGVIIPPVKVVDAGTVVDDVFRLVLAHIRSKHETAGDFRAQIAANVDVVREVRHIAEQLALVVHRRDQADVVQVDAARVRVVRDDHVARPEVLGAVGAHRLRHLLGHRAEVNRLREALRDRAQLRVEERTREVRARLDVRRVRAPLQRERHLVGRRDERVPDHLEGDRI